MTMSSSGPLKRLRRASGDPSRVSLTVIGVFDSVVPSACVVVSTRRIAVLGRSGSCSQTTFEISSGVRSLNRNGRCPVSNSYINRPSA